MGPTSRIYFNRAELRRAARDLDLRFDNVQQVMWGERDDYRIRLDLRDLGRGHRLRTRVRMPGLGLGFWIRPTHLLDRLWDALGGNDIRFGDTRIDDALRIQSDYPDWVRKHLNTLRLRDALSKLLDGRFVVFASDKEVMTKLDARAGDDIVDTIVAALELARALQQRGETPLQTLKMPGLHARASIASGVVDGIPFHMKEVAGPHGSTLEIRAGMPWTTPGLHVGHRDEDSPRIGDPILDMTVSVQADDLEAARLCLCSDEVRGPLAAVVHGRAGSVWRGSQLVTFATNSPTDLAAAVEEVLELAAALPSDP